MKRFIFILSLIIVQYTAWAGDSTISGLGKSNISGAGLQSIQADNHQYSDLAFANGANAVQDKDVSNTVLNNAKDFGTIQDLSQPSFGDNLFKKQCGKISHMRFLNPNYRISIGDKINIQVWGAFQFSQEMTVDTQGNIFLPEIGPIRLQGVENKNLNSVLSQKIKIIFLKDVHIYGDLITAQPVQVYVTGFVGAPGLYNGLSSDSIIYFLCQAEGINSAEGSYRDIKIIRANKQIKNVDLYDFIRHGKIGDFQLRQGDVILVGSRRNTVSVEGNIKSPYTYEINGDSVSMAKLISYAHLNANVTHVRVDSHKGKSPQIYYYPIEQAKSVRLNSGDHLVFTSDQSQNQIVVTVTGEVVGPHQYVLKKGQSLDGLLRKMRFNDEADFENVQLFRPSVAKQQKLAVESSLARLERQTLTSSNITADGAKLQVIQSQLIGKFIEHAKNAQFQGQIILGAQRESQHVLLTNNDVINIPQKEESITISGEVMNSISVELSKRKGYLDYINEAGGFTDVADKKKILLVHKNGVSELIKRNSRVSKAIKSGDQIIVLSKPPSENWQVTESLTQIMYRIAVAARVAILI